MRLGADSGESGQGVEGRQRHTRRKAAAAGGAWASHRFSFLLSFGRLNVPCTLPPLELLLLSAWLSSQHCPRSTSDREMTVPPSSPISLPGCSLPFRSDSF